ncbi:MAG: anti-sigma factor [Solirubrobacteraceae bacterium]
MGEHRDWDGEAAACALGALDPEEAVRFEDHVKTCGACRAELGEMRATAALLPLAAPQVEVPTALRRRVVQQVRKDARRQGAAQGPSRSRPPRFGFPAVVRVRVAAIATGALGAAAVAIAIAVAVGSNGTNQRVHQAKVTFAGGSAVLHVGSGTSQLVIRRMPAAPAGKIYEVWLVRQGHPAPTTALFDVGASGSATVAVPGALSRVSAVLVTAEPRGGSRRPTTKPLIAVKI